MMGIGRGARRTARPDIFISHSSQDKTVAANLAIDLNFCALDVGIDDWGLEMEQSLTDEIAKAMGDTTYVSILITENYNKTVWTKTAYKKALVCAQKDVRAVMLPFIVDEVIISDFLEDKICVDLLADFFARITKIVGAAHGPSQFRISRALSPKIPQSVFDIWQLLQSVGFEPYVALCKEQSDAMLMRGAQLLREKNSHFYPNALIDSAPVSVCVKSLLR